MLIEEVIYYILSLYVVHNILEYLDTQGYRVNKEMRELIMGLAPLLLT
jgi:hypothetical protein